MIVYLWLCGVNKGGDGFLVGWMEYVAYVSAIMIQTKIDVVVYLLSVVGGCSEGVDVIINVKECMSGRLTMVGLCDFSHILKGNICWDRVGGCVLYSLVNIV